MASRTAMSPALLDSRLAVTVPETAALLGVSPMTVSRMIADGRLPGRNIASGRKHRMFIVPVEALRAWVGGVPFHQGAHSRR